MAHAVRFSEFGGPEVLEVVEVPDARTRRGRGARRGVRGRAEPGRERDPARRPPRAVAGRAPCDGRAAISQASSIVDRVRGVVAVHARRRGHGVRRPRRAGDACRRARGQLLPQAAGAHRGRSPGRSTWRAPPRGRRSRASASGAGRHGRHHAPRPGASDASPRSSPACAAPPCRHERRDALRLPPPVRGAPDGVRTAASPIACAPSTPEPVTAFLDFLGGETDEAPRARRAAVAGPHRCSTGTPSTSTAPCRASTPATSSRSAGSPPSSRRRRIRLPIADVFPLDAVGRRLPRARQARGAGQDRARPAHRRLRRASACASPRSRSRTSTLGVPTPHAPHGRRGGRAARDRRRQRAPTAPRGSAERAERRSAPGAYPAPV